MLFSVKYNALADRCPDGVCDWERKSTHPFVFRVINVSVPGRLKQGKHVKILQFFLKSLHFLAEVVVAYAHLCMRNLSLIYRMCMCWRVMMLLCFIVMCTLIKSISSLVMSENLSPKKYFVLVIYCLLYTDGSTFIIWLLEVHNCSPRTKWLSIRNQQQITIVALWGLFSFFSWQKFLEFPQQ